jgi:hypothetical protein
LHSLPHLMSLRLNLSKRNPCIICLLSASLYLTFFSTKIVVTITISCSEWSGIKYTTMLSLVCRNMINLILSLSTRKCQVILRMFRYGNLVCLTVNFLYVARFSALTALSLPISCKLTLPTIGSKCLPYLLRHGNLQKECTYGI